ncbi:hypothetical protein ACEPAF_344 [Sanghuangporus sanghuang]
MPAAEISQGQLVSTTLGAIQIGTYIASALFGLMTMQTYHYYCNYSSDRPFLKVLVGWIWSLELVHTIIITRACYVLAVDRFGDLQAVETVPFSIKLTIIFDTIIAFTVQTFFAWRLRVMSKRWELSVFCWALTVLRTITSLMAVAKFIEIKEQSVFFKESKVLVTVVEIVSAINDVVIAAGLCYYLSRSRSGITGTDRLVGRLIRYSIQSGILTRRTPQLTVLLKFLVMPDNWIWIAVHIVLAKPFSNSFLAMLNARSRLRSHLHHSDHGNKPGVVVVDRGTNAFRGSLMQPSNRRNLPIEIEMSKMTTSTTDEDFSKIANVNGGFAV